ncbi:hypothetical protein DMENIID0001_150560 [Sergentomyia squamirostris]
MVRNCAVSGCTSSDLSRLSHRFPRDAERAQQWKDALNLNKSIEELIEKYTVCQLHFEERDYRNWKSHHLNKTSIPKLVTTSWAPPVQSNKSGDVALQNHGKKSIEIMTIVDSDNLDIETIQEAIVDDIETSHLEVSSGRNKVVNVVKKRMPDDNGEEYYIVVEDEDENSQDLKVIKRKAPDCPEQKSKKIREEIIEEDEESQDYVIPTDSELYDLAERVYCDADTQTDTVPEEPIDEEEVDQDILKSDYWTKGLSKGELIRMLMERDEKCRELEKKIDDFKQAKDKMLQSIEMLKMM